jgi:RNA polymerase sigma-70 factor (ECF subfamily)
MTGGRYAATPVPSRTYCLVPRDLAPRLHECLRRHFAANPAVDVVVERRGTDRRGLPDRRRRAEPVTQERRRIRSVSGRRVADRRAVMVDVRLELPLPRRARPHAERLAFSERIEPAAQVLEDQDTARLITQIQSGDRDAFAHLYVRYYERLYGYLRLIFSRPEAAEDAVQDVFTRVLEALPRYVYRDVPLRIWLFRIARNRAMTELKRQGRVSLSEPQDARCAQPAPTEPARLSALSWISDSELQLFIHRLPLTQRQVLFLRYVVGLSTNEVAGVLNLSADGVRKHHARALNFLRTRLSALGRDTRCTERSGCRVIRKQANVVRLRRFALIAR